MQTSRDHDVLNRLAVAVTFVLSPPLVPPLTIWLVLSWVGAPATETGVLVSATFALLTLLPVVYLLWMVRSGRSETMNLENRKHRSQALAIGVIGGVLILAVAYLVLTVGRGFVISILCTYLLTASLLMLINRFWRISLHAAAVAGFLSIVLFTANLVGSAGYESAPSPGIIAVPAAIAVLVVGWSRLQLGAHSMSQVLAGAGIGLVVPYVFLLAVHAVWPLV